MKKSQILAALAFAFALGVAMPAFQTASVFATDSVFDIATTTADACQVNQVLANIKGYSEYKKYASLYDAAHEIEAKYGTASANINTADTGAIAKLVTAINDVKTTAGVGTPTYVAPTVNYTGTPVAAPIRTAVEVLTIVRDEAKQVLSSNDYTKFNTLYGFMQLNANKVNTGEMARAIHAIDGNFPLNSIWTGQQMQDYVSGKPVNGSTWSDATLYSKYAIMIGLVNDDTELLNAINNLKTALLNFKNWQKNGNIETGKTNTHNAVELAVASTDPVANLMSLVNNTAIVKGYNNQWYLLVDEVEKQSNPDTSTIVNDGFAPSNKSIITKLATLFFNATKASSNNNMGVELKTLPNVGGTCGKPTGDGTGDGTNKPDDEKDPSAPDTGILSNTEASASTTLAMVAGIATALTAAGAGVVAYRNARRSSRK